MLNPLNKIFVLHQSFYLNEKLMCTVYALKISSKKKKNIKIEVIS